eukprot:426172-Amphidinium_carterae.1
MLFAIARLHSSLKEALAALSCKTHSALIRCFGQAGDVEVAVTWFQRLVARGCRASARIGTISHQSTFAAETAWATSKLDLTNTVNPFV